MEKAEWYPSDGSSARPKGSESHLFLSLSLMGFLKRF